MFYDIKPLLYQTPINILYSVIILIIDLIGYFLLFGKKKSNTPPTKSNLNFSKNFEKNIGNLEKLLSQPSEIFYSNFNKILKGIIQSYDNINISNKSLAQIKQLNLPENILDLLGLTYFKEYSNLPDNMETRLKHIQQLKTILQNYKQKGFLQKNIG